MAMTMGQNKQGSYQPMADINVTPFVDVMLVLLVIFMVTAPMMVQGLDVNLPKAEGKGLESSKPRLLVEIKAADKITVDGVAVDLTRLKEILTENEKLKKDKELDLYADESLPYEVVVKVMAKARSAGAETINMITDSASEGG